MVDSKSLKVGDYIAVLNNTFIDCRPYRTPLVITKIGPKRITAQQVLPEGRDPDMWDRPDRHLSASDIVAVYTCLEEAQEAHDRAWDYHKTYEGKITELEKERARAVRSSLQRIL